MKKQSNTLTIAIAVGLAAIGGFLLLKYLKGKKKTPATPLPTPTEIEYEDYIVTTKSGTLNVRKHTSTSSEIIASIPKGTVIKASPVTGANNEDWHATTYPRGYFKGGLCVDCGYVSSKYLTKK